MIWRGCGRQPSLHGGTRWQDAAGAGGLWSPAVDPRRFSPMRSRQTIACALVALVTLLVTSRAGALPVELKDQNGTKYQINTDVSPLLRNSEASGALTNATYVKPVTVTSYFVGLTPFGFFLTTFTVQRQVNIPLTNAFAGFNGLSSPVLTVPSFRHPSCSIRARGSRRRTAARTTRTGSSSSRRRRSPRR